MLVAKQVADFLTIIRIFLAFEVAWLGLSQGERLHCLWQLGCSSLPGRVTASMDRSPVAAEFNTKPGSGITISTSI